MNLWLKQFVKYPVGHPYTVEISRSPPLHSVRLRVYGKCKGVFGLQCSVSLSATYDHQFIPYLGSHVIFRCAHLSYARAVFHSQSISVLPASTSSSVFSCVHSSFARIYLCSRFVNIIERILSCTTLVHSSICDLFHLFVRAIVITIITCHHFCSGL